MRATGFASIAWRHAPKRGRARYTGRPRPPKVPPAATGGVLTGGGADFILIAFSGRHINVGLDGIVEMS